MKEMPPNFEADPSHNTLDMLDPETVLWSEVGTIIQGAGIDDAREAATIRAAESEWVTLVPRIYPEANVTTHIPGEVTDGSVSGFDKDTQDAFAHTYEKMQQFSSNHQPPRN